MLFFFHSSYLHICMQCMDIKVSLRVVSHISSSPTMPNYLLVETLMARLLRLECSLDPARVAKNTVT